MSLTRKWLGYYIFVTKIYKFSLYKFEHYYYHRRYFLKNFLEVHILETTKSEISNIIQEIMKALFSYGPFIVLRIYYDEKKIIMSLQL